MISNLDGNDTLEALVAAAKVFRREANHLERKPLAALLAPDRRDAFRRMLHVQPENA